VIERYFDFKHLTRRHTQLIIQIGVILQIIRNYGRKQKSKSNSRTLDPILQTHSHQLNTPQDQARKLAGGREGFSAPTRFPTKARTWTGAPRPYAQVGGVGWVTKDRRTAQNASDDGGAARVAAAARLNDGKPATNSTRSFA
jgi:hypothetical protein